MLARSLVLTAAVLALNGCAATWAGLELTHSDWSNESYETTRPAGPIERKTSATPVFVAPPPSPPPPPAPPVGEVIVLPASRDPNPPPAPGPRGHWVMVVPPGPDVNPLPPAPPPGDPLHLQGSVRLQCTTSQRQAREQVHGVYFRYTPIWKVLSGFMFLSESVFSAGIIYSGLQDHRDGKAGGTATIAIGGVVGLDALGTLALIFHPPERDERDFERPGPWSSRGECPEGLVAEINGEPAAVTADGALPPGAGEALLDDLVHPEGRFALHDGTAAIEVHPDARGRCVWARSQQLPISPLICPDGLWARPLPGIEAVLDPIPEAPASTKR